MNVTALDIRGDSYEVSTEGMIWRPSVYGIVIDDNKLLLSPQHGVGFDLPGGGMEMFETLEQAVTREVKEETGIDIEPILMLGCEDSFYISKVKGHSYDKTYHSIMMYVLCKKIGGEINNSGFSEHEKGYAQTAEWIDIDSLEGLNQASSIDFMPYVKKAIESYGN